MSQTRNQVLTIAANDADIRISIYVDPALGFPTGLHAIVSVAPQSGPVQSEQVDLLLTAVPRTLSGITATHGANLLKDIVVAARTALGYA